MPDSEIELAAETFKNAVEMKAQLISMLEQKHKQDPRAFFEDEKILATEQNIQSLLAISEPQQLDRIAELTEAYQRLLDEAAIDFRRHLRSLQPPRRRSPMEIRRQKLNKLIRDIGAHRIRSVDEYLDRRDAIFGGSARNQ